ARPQARAINSEAGCALLYRTSAMIDMTEAIHAHLESGRGAGDLDATKLQEELERNTQLIRFFTPLCKYFATEISNYVTRQGIQVHGGIGYMAETPAGHYPPASSIPTNCEGPTRSPASL